MKKTKFGILLILTKQKQYKETDCNKCNIRCYRVEDYRNVIPLSHEIVMVAGNPFVIEKDTRILYLEDNILLERNTQFLAGYIKEATGRRLKVESGQDVNDKNMII